MVPLGENKQAITDSKEYITKYFNLDAEVKNTSYDAKMNSYAISFETSRDGDFTIEYKSPNNFNISRSSRVFKQTLQIYRVVTKHTYTKRVSVTQLFFLFLSYSYIFLLYILIP